MLERVKLIWQRGHWSKASASFIQRRTSGSVGRFFWRAQPQARQEGIGHEAQCQMMVEPGPRAALKMIQAQFFLQLLVSLLDLPALVRQIDQLIDGAVFGKIR
jgi:hypothetical protein